MIPYGRQNISQSDIDAVVEVLQSDFLTQGPKVLAFEEALANYCGANYGVAVNSATSALHVACLALGLSPGDRLWTSPITFVASANCAKYCGAVVDFVDIDPRTYNMSTVALKEKLVAAKANGVLPKIVVPVHLCGQPCEMEEIAALSQEYGFRIIEDASHALGGYYRGGAIGNCRYSDITVFSFHPVKIITTAEGGVAVTNSRSLAERMELLRSHGITRNSSQMAKIPDGDWYYEQVDLGFNYRMTDLQAALGLSQLSRLNEINDKRHEIARLYDRHLATLPVTRPWQHPDGTSGWHLYVIRLNKSEAACTHSELFHGLRDSGIGVNLHYIPIHLQPYYERLGFKKGDFPEAEQYYSEAISLPMYPNLTEAQIEFVVNKICDLVLAY